MNDILTYTVYPNLFPNGYSDVVPLFRIFSSMLSFLFWYLGKPTGKSSVTKVSQRERGPKGPFYRIQGCFNFLGGARVFFGPHPNRAPSKYWKTCNFA